MADHKQLETSPPRRQNAVKSDDRAQVDGRDGRESDAEKEVFSRRFSGSNGLGIAFLSDEYQAVQKARSEAFPLVAAMRGNNIATPNLEDDTSPERIPGLVVTTPDNINKDADSDTGIKRRPGLETESSTVLDYGWSEELKHGPVEELAKETQAHLVGQTGQAFPAHESSQPHSLPELESGSLGTRLRAQAIVHPDEEKGSFVPIEALRILITQESVVEELQRPNSDQNINDVSLEKIAEYVCRKHRLGSSEEKYTTGLKLFAILLLIEKPRAIAHFIAEGLSDKDLPFKLERKNGAFQLLQKNEPFDKIKAFTGWKHIEVEAFERNQWSLLSPIFTKADKVNKVLNYPLESKILLPFVESEERSLSNPQLGGYGTVFKVRIHSSHHSFDRPEGINPYFAVKKLFSPDEKAFHKEVETLKRFSINSHEHLIKLLATYKHMNSYHLIFPWADGNLRKFWEAHPKPTIDSNLALWTADQCHGLAVGLGKIHHYQSSSDSKNLGVDSVSSSRRRPYGRHSDIKPENILWFKDYHSPNAFNGVLKISDFGLTQFNSRQSRSAMPAGEMERTPTYRPPECDMPENRISQAWDMWTLGCVYLEFITWLLKGFQAVNDSFVEQRLSDNKNSNQEFKEDTFFVIENGSASLKRSVSSWIDQLHQDINCTAYLHDLLNFVLHSLLNPSPLHRAKCPEVVEKLNNMRQQCRTNEEYHLARVPKIVNCTPPGPYHGESQKAPGEVPPTQKILEKEQLVSSPRHSLDSNASLGSSLRSERVSTRPGSPQRKVSVRFMTQDKAASSPVSIDGLDDVLEDKPADTSESVKQTDTRQSSKVASLETAYPGTMSSVDFEKREGSSSRSIHQPGNITQMPLESLREESVEQKAVNTSNAQAGESKGKRGGILTRALARVNMGICRGFL